MDKEKIEKGNGEKDALGEYFSMFLDKNTSCINALLKKLKLDEVYFYPISKVCFALTIDDKSRKYAAKYPKLKFKTELDECLTTLYRITDLDKSLQKILGIKSDKLHDFISSH